jgi:hypothetical protein
LSREISQLLFLKGFQRIICRWLNPEMGIHARSSIRRGARASGTLNNFKFSVKIKGIGNNLLNKSHRHVDLCHYQGKAGRQRPHSTAARRLTYKSIASIGGAITR